MPDLFTIAELAKEFDISTRTIRFYEDKGLISPSRAGTNRIFRKKDKARLTIILRGKRLGFSIDDIGEYLSLYDTDGIDRQSAQLIEKIDGKLASLTQQQHDLKNTIAELATLKTDTLNKLNHK